MKSDASTVDDYIASIPEERQPVVQKIRSIINSHLPPGFEETMSYGMIGWVVPHSLYPEGYHCDTKLPLPFINLASQKNFIALYHSGVYADPDLMKWFVDGYAKSASRKLDMGKSCVRFKYLDDIPYELIGQLAEKLTVEAWVDLYENQLKNHRRKKA